MYSPNRAGLAATYLEQDIRNADPTALVARVLEMAALHIGRARAALASGDVRAKGTEVGRVLDCVSYLQCCLDLENGGEPARNMDRLYAYMTRRISEGHLRNEDAAFAEVGGHLAELGSAWRQVSSRPVTEAAAAATAGAAR